MTTTIDTAKHLTPSKSSGLRLTDYRAKCEALGPLELDNKDVLELLDAYEAERERAEVYKQALRQVGGDCNSCKYRYPIDASDYKKLYQGIEKLCDRYKRDSSCWVFDMERFGK
jgi:hypothetical protein